MPARLNGENYHAFLRDQLPGLIERAALPPETLNNLIFLHDGAPAHFSNDVREHLGITYPGRWIGRGGPVPWPPRSPDLNFDDYYLWGRIKNMVYQGETSTREMTWQRIQDAFATLTAEEIKRASQNLYTRAAMCLANNGMHFEHL